MVVSPLKNSQSIAQSPLSHTDAERLIKMREAWKAYKGEFKKPLKVDPAQPDDNVISNRCRPIVDKVTSFLFGPVLKIEASDESGQEDSPLQAYLEGMWGDDDERMTLLSLMAINGGVSGMNFVKMIPPQGSMRFPRLVVLDPMLVRIVTAPDDCSLILAYIIEYPGPGDLQKRQVIARVDPDNFAGVAGEYDLDDTWTVTNYQRRSQVTGQVDSWQQVGEQEVWPYPFAPIFCNQNLPNPNEPWGTPDLTPDLIAQNNVLNFVQSNSARIIKFHAHPKTWAKGVGAEQINIGVDDLIVFQSMDAQMANLEMTSDLHSSLSFADVIRADMDEQSRVPAVALGRLADLPKGSISGVALQLLFQPLLEKTVQKQRLYGKAVRDISRASLVIGGLLSLDEYEDYKIELHWQDLLPIDDLVAAQTAQLLMSLGVSQTTVLQQLGYDSDDEATKVEKENARKQPAPPALSPDRVPPQQGAESPFIGRDTQNTPEG